MNSLDPSVLVVGFTLQVLLPIWFCSAFPSDLRTGSESKKINDVIPMIMLYAYAECIQNHIHLHWFCITTINTQFVNTSTFLCVKVWTMHTSEQALFVCLVASILASLEHLSKHLIWRQGKKAKHKNELDNLINSWHIECRDCLHWH